MDWLQNGWVTGIGGGIVSGLIVYLITAWLFSNQSRREAARKIAAANQEITLAVRQGIPESRIPSRSVLEALIKATARKHSLQSSDLYGPGEIAQDLIKEVMDSSFISAEAKEGYCERLAELDGEKQTSKSVSNQMRMATRSTQTAAMSLALAMSASIMSAILMIVMKESGTDSIVRSKSITISVLLPIATMGLVAVIMLTFLTLQRWKRQGIDDLRIISFSDGNKASGISFDSDRTMTDRDST